jgi:hypothetical protein
MRLYGRRLTPKQIRDPWTYIGTPNGEISGVVIASDGDRPGFRVMLVDLGLPEFPPVPPPGASQGDLSHEPPASVTNGNTQENLL